ncbi:multidrug ABC transporter ATP-binding protein [Terribacillus saccharophilus]|uniref:ATP-binding cassette domain-containing protein n=1 Tax=Terribacillus saccharophilus TaxID=361277 RepID=UPI000BA76E93|nr:ABC transporter ATP-binding protein [Terribacillus saccharophilus]PAF36241.1 multidrug ABC transporter ATP-binding protein [Terribacillus saccharophilus]
MVTINVQNLNKKLKKNVVLRDVNYNFRPGTIYGIYGRNGSGKTMLLRALAGLIYPDSGKILINNEILHEDISFPPSIGLTIENTSLLPQYDAYTNLKILSKIKKVASDDDIKRAIKRVGLDPNSKLKVRKFSLGMRQRLSIAQAIFEEPEFILLDEPTNALDDSGVELVRSLLLEEKQRGATILIASHNKEDLEILSDYKVKIEEGMIVSE